MMVLDLRDPYSSFRWNPLGDIYDRYQLYLKTGEEIYERTDAVNPEELELVNAREDYGEVWYEYEGRAYASRRDLINKIRIEKQKIYDELYEDLNDLISVICPVESKDESGVGEGRPFHHHGDLSGHAGGQRKSGAGDDQGQILLL